MKRALVAASLAVTFTAARGQPPPPLAFEAASIKINTSGRPGGGMNRTPARIKIINSTLRFCVVVAWNVKDFQVAGASGWMDTIHYDIDAVAAAPFKNDEYRQMLQTLLADRFGLVIHHETQDKPGFALVVAKAVAKNGPKLPPPIEDPGVMFSRTPSGDRTLEATSISLSRFAEALSTALGATVVDHTGIEGKFNFSFQWTPDSSTAPILLKSGEPAPPPPPDAMSGPSIFTALQDKFGLKLESKKVPVDVIVIDSANRPSEN